MVPSSTADRISATVPETWVSLRSLFTQQAQIILLTGRHSVADAHQIELPHIDHGIFFYQLPVVLQGDEVGGLVGNIEQEREGGTVALILDHPLGGSPGRLLGGTGNGVEFGLFGALVAQEKAQIRLIAGSGGDAGVHIYVVVERNIVIALGRDLHVPLAEHGVDEPVDQRAVIVVLLHDERGEVNSVHPLRDLFMVGAFAGNSVHEHRSPDIRASKKTDGLDHTGTDPPGIAGLVNLKRGGGEKKGGILKAQMAHHVAIQRLGRGVFDSLAIGKADHLDLLGDHIHHNVSGQTVGAVGEPPNKIGVFQGGHTDGTALIVDLGGVVGHLKLAGHVGNGTHLCGAQISGGVLVQQRNFIKGNFLYIC